MKQITSKIIYQLGQIGFEEDETNNIQMIHELKGREDKISIKELINRTAFQNLSKGIAETFEKNKWDEEDFFQIVERYRDEKKR